MATPLKGGRSAPTEGQPAPAQQPEPKLLDNAPTSSLSKALAQSKAQVDASK
jgi:hypothetical protein